MHVINECNNKLTIVTGAAGPDLVFSYSSLIGIIYNNTFILNEYYSNYSNTTGRHINTVFNEYYASYLIKVSNNTFNKLEAAGFKEVDLKEVLRLNKIEFYSLLNIEGFKKDLKTGAINTNNYLDCLINLNQKIELLTGNRLEVINSNLIELKTRYKLVKTYKTNNITFNIIKTYNKSSKKLINVKCNNIKAAAL